MQLNLLEKTELKIYGLVMNNANLSLTAAKIAEVLGLPAPSVLVVDVRNDHICLDILEKNLDMRQVAGKEKQILDELAMVPGLTVTENAYVDAAGILGLIACDANEAETMIVRSEEIAGDIEQAVLRRAMVFATGFEVQNGMIEDTNSPFLLQLLTRQGYKTEFGGILDDNVQAIRRKLSEAVEDGYGLLITTGGVGAEDKDFSVEAVTKLDAAAATPWIVKFEQGTGRHVKAGVRIGVGQVGMATIINLPGPHDEVVASAAALQKHCAAGRIEKTALAEDIARILRDKLRNRKWHHQH